MLFQDVKAEESAKGVAAAAEGGGRWITQFIKQGFLRTETKSAFHPGGGDWCAFPEINPPVLFQEIAAGEG